MGYRIINGKAYPVGQFNNIENNISKNKVKENNKQTNFKDVLNKTVTNVKSENSFTISNHASERLKSINFTSIDYKEIQRGFKIADKKGAKNTLMFYKDVALIASIKNKTIITAIEKERAKENVFTNIDSVIIL